MTTPMHPMSTEDVSGNRTAFAEATDEMKTLVSAVAFGDAAAVADIIDIDTEFYLYDHQSESEFYEEHIESTDMVVVDKHTERGKIRVADRTQRNFDKPTNPSELQ